ncbi:MAG: hypothetical protein OZSIB_2052 [Candidatus Ozemobacter sibiricus]|uniref:Uncharacterized protein n=1 Tax=Candidatus Ozemobacter sibiricus TaxID=2268124 RepID=A0A367ZIF0_9BACT|nr:MAG: hypothetical protein OZSIB_2052 [Candidatus Ozemobacter sibiricus]
MAPRWPTDCLRVTRESAHGQSFAIPWVPALSPPAGPWRALPLGAG